jgi:23S rRNA pseudouridine1911/1915/1917 synthase
MIDDGLIEGQIELRPERDDKNQRLDKFVATRLSDLGISRTSVQGLIDEGHVLVDGVPRRSTFKMTPGEVVNVHVPEVVEASFEPEPIPLDVQYEDEDVLVINKPAGLVVHPAPGHPTGTLVNALLYHAPGISVGGSSRPGIVHRLDKDTSGLMVIAKSDRGHASLLSQWGERSVRKGYRALVRGLVEPDEGTVDAPIGRDPTQRQRMGVTPTGRTAVTHFTVDRRFIDTTLLDLEIETGRTHQIRVHLAFIGHPIAGDVVYGRGQTHVEGLDRQFLHASHLGFRLPGGEAMSFDSPLPPDLQGTLNYLIERTTAT